MSKVNTDTINKVNTDKINKISRAVTISGLNVVVTSFDVAAIFEKTHEQVVQAIENIIKTSKNKLPLFWFWECHEDADKTKYAGKKAKKAVTEQKQFSHFEITQEAFSLLAAGFTGAKALPLKIAFFEAFAAKQAELDKFNAGRDTANIKAALKQKSLQSKNSKRLLHIWDISAMIENLRDHTLKIQAELAEINTTASRIAQDCCLLLPEYEAVKAQNRAADILAMCLKNERV